MFCLKIARLDAYILHKKLSPGELFSILNEQSSQKPAIPFFIDYRHANRYILNISATPYYKKRYVPAPVFRKNSELPAREYRVIGEDSQNLGVLDRDAALQIAIDKGLDLIEISASANPPVARIGSYDKFRYQKEKELKKEKQAQSRAKDDIKHVRIGLGSGRNDLLIRARQIDEFLKEGYKVEILLKLRGREKANKEWALGKFNEFFELITENYRVIMSPKAGGVGFVAQISKA